MPLNWRLYLDSNFFIQAVEGTDAISENSWELMEIGEKHPGLLVTSLLTLSEVLVAPLRMMSVPPPFDPLVNEPLTPSQKQWLRAGTLASEYADLIMESQRLSVVEIDRHVLMRAARIRSQWHSGKLPDAIHLASALVNQCTHMVSADKKMSTAASNRFKMTVVRPNDLADVLADIGADL